MVRDLLGVSFVSVLTLAHDVLRLVLWSWVVTTATMVSQSKTGRITALKYSSYSYWIRNYGCTGGFYGGSSYFMELCVCCNWNLVC